MAFAVVLEDERSQERERVLERRSAFHELIPPLSDAAFRCVGFIDPYGHVVFNRLQLPLLVDELRILLPRADQEQRDFIGAVLGLAQKCMERPHLYLRFKGD